MTITTTNALATRLSAALGKELGYGRDATPEEIKAYVVDVLRNVVHKQEQQPPAPPAWEPT